jgi:hypothetical protein
MNVAEKGTWVQVEQLVLRPQERAPTLPEDTRAVPYMMRVSGFLLDDAAVIGDEVRISTLIGRELSGKLETVGPSYDHSFGETVQELADHRTRAGGQLKCAC